MKSLKSRVKKLEEAMARLDTVHIMCREGVIYHTGHVRYIDMVGKTIDEMKAVYPKDNLNFINYVLVK